MEMETETEAEMEINIEKDALGIWKHMQHHESQLSLKRRYLMGLSTPESFHQNATSNSPLPESFMREHDLFYDRVQILVRQCFGACNVDAPPQLSILPDVQFSGLQKLSATVLTLLDDFSNYGLYNLANLFAGGLLPFVKTRPQMKRLIESALLAIQRGQHSSDYLLRLRTKLSHLLNSPQNFRYSCRKKVKLTVKELRVDIMKVLDGLKDMKFLALTAMYAKLKGRKASSPRLHCRSSRKTKALLIKQVRNGCLDMIQRLDESDELQEPLVKALSVAGLSLNMTSSSQDLWVPTFLRMTPGRKRLQDEIVKAIQLLDRRIRKEDMNKLRHLLVPDCKAEGRSLKSAIRNMLTGFLFECIDMDAVPDSLLGALSLINRRLMHDKHRSLSKDLINEDVECILNVSAYLKQLLWECNPSSQLDQDFVDAYMDEAEESDDGDIFDDSDDDQKHHPNSMDEGQIRFDEFSEEVGSTSYADDASVDSPSSTRKPNLKYTGDVPSPKLSYDVCSDTETSQSEMLIPTIGKNDSSPLCLSGLVDSCTMGRQEFSKSTMKSLNDDGNCLNQNVNSGYQKNCYVAIQDVCDNTSIVAFQLVGHVLSQFGHLDALGLDENEESYLRGGNLRTGHFGDLVSNLRDKDVSGSIVVEAVHNVLPLFSKRDLEGLKKFMSS